MNAINTLLNKDAFITALRDYHVSANAASLLQRVQLVLLVGPTSCGRNTIINRLLQSPQYHQLISDTTRLPRTNDGILEQNGVEYWFRDEAAVLQDIQTGAFLEAAIIHDQQVSGISMRELARAADAGLTAINEIEVVGADNIYAAKPDTRFLFIVPPSFDEWMVRMNGRGQLPDIEIRRRLNSAIIEIETALSRDYYDFVVNDTFKQTSDHIHAMITEGSAHDSAHGRAVAAQVMADTQHYVAQAR